MAHRSTMDGAEFTNYSGLKKHEARLKAKADGAPEVKSRNAAHTEEAEEQEQDSDSVVKAHGPAEKVEISGTHVKSFHPDGHVHESDHASPEEAHECAKGLAGVGSAPEEAPEEEEGGASPSPDGGSYMASLLKG